MKATPVGAGAVAALVLACAGSGAGAGAQVAAAAWHGERDRLVATIDSLARAHAADERVAGVSLAVVLRGDTLALGGYGFADLEWRVPTPDDAVYEIGSVTKQFTAVAALLLAEEGKLDLDADLTTYLPDYDTQGRAVPLRRLFDHTSGIKGYTEMPAFGEIVMRDLPRDSLVARFEAEPFEFEPGGALIYNNSAYFLLGLVVEKVSGRSYEEFVQERLFDALGMSRSYYCDERAVVDRRAHGYDGTPEGLVQKGYLDHLWPYAAGSLCSTVGDLVRWNQALHGGRVLRAGSYHDLVTPRPLADGSPTRYAMGLGVDVRRGRRVIAHGGGINGFLADARWYPDDELLVVALQNSTGPLGPAALSTAVVDVVLGPGAAPAASPFRGDLAALAGEYRGPARGRELTVRVRAEGDQLVLVPEGAPEPTRPVHEDGLTWRAGNTLWRFVERGGAVVELRMDTVSGHYVLKRVGGS